MLVDLHIHESSFSSDSRMTLEEIVAAARQKGLDGICITDHDSMGLKDHAEEYSRRTGYPIFVGVEYYSLWGDITAWGIESFPAERIPAQDFIDHVREQGGFCVACHPFRNNNRGFEDNLRNARGLNGVEVLNGSTDMAANRKALAYCTEIGLVPVGASDVTWKSQVGRYSTWLPGAGTTIAGVAKLEEFGLRNAVMQAVHAGALRSKELGKN